MIEQAFYRDTRSGKDRFATENFRILRHHAAHDRNYALETQSIQANITDHLFPIQRFNDSTINVATASLIGTADQWCQRIAAEKKANSPRNMIASIGKIGKITRVSSELRQDVTDELAAYRLV